MSTADDGGSSGRLRDMLGVPALGDLRKCIGALASDDSTLPHALEIRYREHVLEGHATGNLVLAGLLAEYGDLERAVEEACRLVGAVGRVIPATTVPTELRAELAVGELVGQAAIGRNESIRLVSLLPDGVQPPSAALEAIAEADQIVIGPGSLYTSVLAAGSVPGIAEALAVSEAQRVYVCNLRPQVPETEGYSLEDHLKALQRHGVSVDIVLFDPRGGMERGNPQMAVVDVDLRGSNGLVHEPGKLAGALRALI